MKNTTGSGPLEHAEAVGAHAREFSARLRRMVVTRSNSDILQVTGHTLLDGDVETWEAESFQGIGYAARPAEDEEVEAIVGLVGGPGNPIVIATRNQATRVSMAADLAAGETQLHNAVVLIRILAGGKVEIRTKNGTPKKLAFQEDLDALEGRLSGHGHPSFGAGPLPTYDPITDPVPSPFPAWSSTGTEVLEAE